MGLQELLRTAPELRITMTVAEMVDYLEEEGRRNRGSGRWVKLSVASQMTGLPARTLRRRAARWERAQLMGARPPVRVERLGHSDRSNWLLNEDDLRRLMEAA